MQEIIDLIFLGFQETFNQWPLRLWEHALITIISSSFFWLVIVVMYLFIELNYASRSLTLFSDNKHCWLIIFVALLFYIWSSSLLWKMWLFILIKIFSNNFWWLWNEIEGMVPQLWFDEDGIGVILVRRWGIWQHHCCKFGLEMIDYFLWSLGFACVTD